MFYGGLVDGVGSKSLELYGGLKILMQRVRMFSWYLWVFYVVMVVEEGESHGFLFL